MEKGTIVITPDDIPYYVLGSWISQLVVLLIDAELARLCAISAVTVTIMLAVLYLIRRWA